MYNNSDSAWQLRNSGWQSCVLGGEVLDNKEDFIDFDKEWISAILKEGSNI